MILLNFKNPLIEQLFSAFWLRSSVVSVLNSLIAIILAPLGKWLTNFYSMGNIQGLPGFPALSSALHHRLVMTARKGTFNTFYDINHKQF